MQANSVDVICLFEMVFKLTWHWISYIWKVKMWIKIWESGEVDKMQKDKDNWLREEYPRSYKEYFDQGGSKG